MQETEVASCGHAIGSSSRGLTASVASCVDSTFTENRTGAAEGRYHFNPSVRGRHRLVHLQYLSFFLNVKD